MGAVGPVAINQMAIHEAIRLYEVPFPQDTFEKVVRLGRHFIELQNEEMRLKAGR
jgi:hypothetical protein